MLRSSTSWYIVTVVLSGLISTTHLTTHDNSHEYISDNERYFGDFSFVDRELSSGLRSNGVGDNSKFRIKFDPATLDFRHRPLGVPHIRRVHLFNFDTNRSIDMTSVSGSTVHFHSSFFQDKKIPPMGNTSFNVVFLGREEGYIESCLFIHTTNGNFKYNVKGVSVYSPYRLRPIVDIKIPVNATFGPLIHLYNPHSEPIQILEIYTSGGDFHLELPGGGKEAPKNIWEIAPYETKAVIRVKFTAKMKQNHTAYLRIKLNVTEEILVVPLEVEVGSRGGIFSPQGYVDFGMGGSEDSPKKIELCLKNPFTKPVKIQSITTSSASIVIEYKQNVIIPAAGKLKCFGVANVTLDWRKVWKYKELSGKLLIKYRNGKSLAEVPYFLTILEGGMSYNPEVTKYFTNDKSKSLTRVFKIKNEFKSPVKILNLTLGAEVEKYFNIRDFKSLVLKQGEETALFLIDLRNNVKVTGLNVNSHITVRTNVSEVVVPVLSYKGVLKLVSFNRNFKQINIRIGFQYLPFKSRDYSLDVGLISLNAKKEVHFLLLNENPVNIQISSLKTSIPLTSTTIVGCARGNPKTALLQHSFENLEKCSNIKSGAFAILKLTVQTANNEGHVWGEIQVETDYENLSIPVQFRVASGKLEIGPDRLVFDQCFPGKICSHPLKVHSTFKDPMIIKNIVSLPPDNRLTSKHSGHIMAHTTKIVGHLYLNPNVECGNACYAGMNRDIYDKWLKTFQLPKFVVHFDLNLFNTFHNRFLNITWNGSRKWQNLTLRLDTSEVRSHTFKTRVKMSWPSLLVHDNLPNRSLVTFPLTQIGNVTYRNLTVRNPSSHNLIVQLVLDEAYPNVELLYEGLPSSNLPPRVPSTTRAEGFFIKINPDHRREVTNVYAHPSSVPLMLRAGENYTITIGFKGDQIGEYSSLLFLRNNLTVIEAVRLRGKSSDAVFRFGNRKPGSLQPLIFEFGEKQARECEAQNQPNLAIKRSFTARNMGEIPISVRGFLINDAPCEGYGFKVSDCSPFVLAANGSKKIDIEFTPDFTLAKIIRTLIVWTSCNFQVNYTLQATIPSYYMSVCWESVSRPTWEPHIFHVTITFCLSAIILLMFVSIFDSEKNKRLMIDVAAANSPSVQPILDLRLLGQQAKEEIRLPKTDLPNGTPKIDKNPEIYKTKQPEVEKGSVLIPTVGKTKKKLGKRISNETSEYAEIPKKLAEICKHKPIYNEKKEEDKKPSHSIRETKKAATCKKLNKSVTEEETTPITTEINTNLDDKENRNSKKPTKIENATQIDDNTKAAPQKIEKRKLPKNVLKTKETIENNNKSVQTRGEKRKHPKEHKEKVAVCRKSSSEKSTHRPCEQQICSPIANAKVWTESRATFSDVVARSDAISNRTMLNKPTMYVEPYKKATTPLGPIGSKPPEFWHNENNQPDNSANSFFSNYRNADNQLPLGSWNGLEKEKTYRIENVMTSPPNYVTPTPDYNVLDSWSNNLATTNCYWNNGLSAPSGAVQRNAPVTNRENNYLWGSSSVWDPWVPMESQRTLPRTPPGFSAVPPVDMEQEESRGLQRVETYNPFTSSNIWSQQQNIWKYSKDQ